MQENFKPSISDKFLEYYFRSGFRGAAKFYRLLGKRNVLAKTKFDSLFELDPFEYIDGIILREGYYESEVLEAILNSLQDNGIFWDIGAYNGLHSITVKKLKPNVEVIAFEPFCMNFIKLLKNEKLNKLSIKKFNIALSHQRGIINLYPIEGNLGMTGIIKQVRENLENNLFVSIEMGDNLINYNILEIPNVIKIDVEGNELNVINGCKTILENNKLKAIIIETSEDLLTNVQSDTFRLLNKYGFRFKKLIRKENTYNKFENYLARR